MTKDMRAFIFTGLATTLIFSGIMYFYISQALNTVL